MSIINQPFSINGNDTEIVSLGNILLEQLKQPCYKELCIFSAFAKNSGVLRLAKAIKAFRERGGSVRAFVGVDLQGTSEEALVNLLRIVDELYVVHSNGGHTFHSKIYFLKGENDYWYAIGSNNLTAGGLWTNIESAYFQKANSLSDPEVLEIQALVAKYSNPTFDCSIRIKTEAEIHKLKEDGYITSEANLSNYSTGTGGGKAKRDPRFGEVKTRIPRIKRDEKAPEDKKQTETEEEAKKEISYLNESFWFQTKKATGGSRNILDLSKTGEILGGPALGTKYETSGTTVTCLGGVAFFGIDPFDYGDERNITLNYDGNDYFPSTIKFTPGNGSWRMQIKGDNQTNPSLPKMSLFGSRDLLFVDKILIFDKMGDDYYALYVLEDNQTNLDAIKGLSIFWASNGRISAKSKLYGFLPKKSTLL